MKRTKILNAKNVKRTTFAEAETAFYKHCKLKNLRPSTMNYYREDLTFFHTKTGVKYIDEVNKAFPDRYYMCFGCVRKGRLKWTPFTRPCYE